MPTVTERLQGARRRSHALARHRAAALEERNHLIAILSRLWPSHLSPSKRASSHTDTAWSFVVCVHSPAGQLAWHLTNDEARGPLFRHLRERANDWDGHTTEQKRERLSALVLRGLKK